MNNSPNNGFFGKYSLLITTALSLLAFTLGPTPLASADGMPDMSGMGSMGGGGPGMMAGPMNGMGPMGPGSNGAPMDMMGGGMGGGSNPSQGSGGFGQDMGNMFQNLGPCISNGITGTWQNGNCQVVKQAFGNMGDRLTNNSSGGNQGSGGQGGGMQGGSQGGGMQGGDQGSGTQGGGLPGVAGSDGHSGPDDGKSCTQDKSATADFTKKMAKEVSAVRGAAPVAAVTDPTTLKLACDKSNKGGARTTASHDVTPNASSVGAMNENLHWENPKDPKGVVNKWYNEDDNIIETSPGVKGTGHRDAMLKQDVGCVAAARSNEATVVLWTFGKTDPKCSSAAPVTGTQQQQQQQQQQ